VRVTDKTGATNVTVTAEPSSHQALDVAAYQSTSPWVTSRNWTLSSPGDSVQCTQGSPPWSVSQSGTWTVQQGTPPWSVSQSGTWTTGRTWTLSSGSDSVSAVQSGPWTVTANAGTNLNTSALALDTSVNGILNAQGSTTSGQTGPLCQGAVTTAAPSYSTGKTDPLSLTTAGALRVDGSGSTQPVSGTVTANQGTSPWVDKDQADGPVTPGTVASFSQLAGGQYNTTLPTLTNTQQSAVQLDSNGRVLTTTNIGSIASTVAPSLSDNVKAEAQLSTIAIPSSSSYTTIYTYSGSGYFLGMNLEFNNTSIVVRLQIDGKTVFDGVDIGQYNGLAVTSNATTRYQQGEGIISSSSVFDYSTRYPIAYTSSVVISARLTSGAVSRNFQQGIVYIQKDT